MFTQFVVRPVARLLVCAGDKSAAVDFDGFPIVGLRFGRANSEHPEQQHEERTERAIQASVAPTLFRFARTHGWNRVGLL